MLEKRRNPKCYIKFNVYFSLFLSQKVYMYINHYKNDTFSNLNTYVFISNFPIMHISNFGCYYTYNYKVLCSCIEIRYII